MEHSVPALLALLALLATSTATNLYKSYGNSQFGGDSSCVNSTSKAASVGIRGDFLSLAIRHN